jgi:4-amino-4-deoxy-L-arabinose transferase-like glycosyltransferase
MFPFWKDILAGLSPDGAVTDYSWLTLQIMLTALIAPGIALFAWGPIRRHTAEWNGCLQRLPAAAFLTYVLGTAALARILVVSVLPLRLFSDFATYDELGWLWAMRGEYTNGQGPTAYFPPGWPFFLSRLYIVFGHAPHAAVIANIALGTASVWLTWKFFRVLSGQAAARWAALIVAMLPSQTLFANLLASEILFTCLLLLAIVVLAENRASPAGANGAATLSGMILGLATLTRSVSFLFPIVMIPLCGIPSGGTRGQVLQRWGWLVAGLLLVVTPWMARNQNCIDRFTVSTNTGVNLYIGNNPNSGAGYNQPDPSAIFLDSASEAHDDSVGFAKAIQYIAADPWAFLVRGAIKTAYCLSTDADGLLYELTHTASSGTFDRYAWLAVFAQSCWMIFLLLTVAGLGRWIRLRRWRDGGGVFVGGAVLYWLAIPFVFFGSGRHHFPLVPILAGLAALALCAEGGSAAAPERE